MPKDKPQANYTVQFEKEPSGVFKFAPKSLVRMGKKMRLLANPVVLVSAAILGLGIKGIASFKSHEKTVNKLNQSLIKQGVFSASLSKTYQDMAASIQKKTTASDETIMDVQGRLQAFAGKTAITEDLVMATLDLAANQGIDLKAATKQIGQTLGSSTNALKTYGIAIDANASKQDKMNAISDGIKKQMGGQAEAQGEGLGALNQLGNAVQDIFVVIGKALAPSVIFFVKQLTEIVVSLQTNVTFVRGIEDAIDAMASGVVIFKGVIFAVYEDMFISIQMMSGVFGDLFKGQFKKAFESLKSGTEKRMTSFLDNKKQTIAHIEEIAQNREDDRKRDPEGDALKRSTATQGKMTASELKQHKEATAKRIRLAEVQGEQDKFVRNTKSDAKMNILNMFSQMQSSKLSALLAVGKIATLAIMTINILESIKATIDWLSGIPFIGWVLAIIAVIAIIAFYIEQVAGVVGASLAEGGVVSNGELVTPLPDGVGMSNVVNVTIEGGLSGSDIEVRNIADIIYQEAG